MNHWNFVKSNETFDFKQQFTITPIPLKSTSSRILNWSSHCKISTLIRLKMSLVSEKSDSQHYLVIFSGSGRGSGRRQAAVAVITWVRICVHVLGVDESRGWKWSGWRRRRRSNPPPPRTRGHSRRSSCTPWGHSHPLHLPSRRRSAKAGGGWHG